MPPTIFLLGAALLLAQEKPAAHFHHIHLNSTDPASAIQFYTSRLDCEAKTFGETEQAVRTQKSWLLFHKTASAPPAEIVSAIWHFGWGAEDMKAAYQKQLDMGTRFDTPITDISDLANYPGFFFAYIDGPDHALIELNTARHHHFGHLHLLSADPIAAGEWYAQHFGARLLGSGKPSREPVLYRGFPVGPSSSLMMDNVNIIIFPMAYAQTAFPKQWAGRKTFESTKGRVVDHIGFRVDDLAGTLKQLRAAGVRVTEPERTAYGGKIKYAFLEGPDRIRIEVLEDHLDAANDAQP